jgi:hypothetical protein
VSICGSFVHPSCPKGNTMSSRRFQPTELNP